MLPQLNYELNSAFVDRVSVMYSVESGGFNHA